MTDKPISGYSKLTDEQVDLVNEFKAIERQLGTLIKKARTISFCDPRNLNIGITESEALFMRLCRAVTKPEDVYR